MYVEKPFGEHTVFNNNNNNNMVVNGHGPREFKELNFEFSESCTKKNALHKLARMSRVRHNAKCIENRYNKFKILTKLFETFCPLHERPRHFEKDQAAH